MKLCLDELYARAIAESLRGRNHDAISVKERQDLVGSSDRDLLRAMQADARALVTENVSDFMPMIQELAAIGEDHWGMIFTSPRSMPRAAATIGMYVEALDIFMSERPEHDDSRNEVSWLQAPA